MSDRFSPPERRIAVTLLVISALGFIWHAFEDLRPPPPPVRLIREAFGPDSPDSTGIFDLNAGEEGIVYSSGSREPPGPIDIREADEATLLHLPGIGPVLAGLRAVEALGIPLPLRSESLLGLRGLRSVAVADDLARLEFEVRPAEESLRDVV